MKTAANEIKQLDRTIIERMAEELTRESPIDVYVSIVPVLSILVKGRRYIFNTSDEAISFLMGLQVAYGIEVY